MLEIKIFAEVYFVYKKLKITMIARCNLFNTIAIIIILDTLYHDFEVIMASILKTRDKTIKKI